jgi:hypothetical protein
MEKEKLNDTWVVWYHYDINSWTKDSFRKLITLDNVQDFWYFVEGIKTLNNILIEHIYFIREGIMPMWEDARNRNGGCWSIKIDIKDSYVIFVKILMFLVCERSLINNDKNISNEVNGLSLCQKNNYNCILQIWNSDKKNNKISYLPKEVIEPFGFEVIWKPHNPEY